MQEPWRTAIVQADDSTIRLRGYDITELMQRATFADTVFLLHRERLPNSHERRLLDAILTSVADHGSGAPSCATARLAASGNRESLSAAIAAGILAIGDDHGGAGAACMSMIAEGIALAREQALTLGDAARQIVDKARSSKQRLPGMGHRVHSVDPRTAVLFAMARKEGVAGNGVLFMEALDAARPVRRPSGNGRLEARGAMQFADCARSAHNRTSSDSVTAFCPKQRNWIDRALRIRGAETPRLEDLRHPGGLFKVGAAWRKLQGEVTINPNVSVIV